MQIRSSSTSIFRQETQDFLIRPIKLGRNQLVPRKPRRTTRLVSSGGVQSASGGMSLPVHPRQFPRVPRNQEFYRSMELVELEPLGLPATSWELPGCPGSVKRVMSLQSYPVSSPLKSNLNAWRARSLAQPVVVRGSKPTDDEIQTPPWQHNTCGHS